MYEAVGRLGVEFKEGDFNENALVYNDENLEYVFIGEKYVKTASVSILLEDEKLSSKSIKFLKTFLSEYIDYKSLADEIIKDSKFDFPKIYDINGTSVLVRKT